MKTIGITFGDVAGIGPEVALSALASDRVQEKDARYILLGDAGWLAQLCRSLRIRVEIPVVKSVEEAAKSREYVVLVDSSPVDLAQVEYGRPQEAAGRAALHWIEQAVQLCRDHVLDAMVTGPISKRGIAMAGSPFPGHTELLAHLTGAPHAVMMLVGGPLRVILVTTHLPLREVAAALTQEKIIAAISLGSLGLKRLGIERPVLAVAGLNPHAGEDGRLGNEEKDIIEPALVRARQEGLELIGPLPADTLFYRALEEPWDGVVCMYHDQGLAPLKMLAFDRAVNVTLGLPIVRTSPDHGTAYDRAGQGTASPDSMIEAVNLAYRLAGGTRAPGPRDSK